MRTILLVDDDPQFAQLLALPIEARGARLVCAQSARAAWPLLQSERPDLVIVDGLLPDTDGVSWIAQLRRAGHATPVVFASAFWRDKHALRQLSGLDVSLVVHKPVTIPVFVEQLATLLGLEPPQAAPEQEVEIDIDLDDQFAQLRTDYARALPTKSRDLATAVAQAASGDVLALEEAATRAHRLRGTAGSYGFPEVGEAAGTIEELLRRIHRGEVAATEGWSEVLQAQRALGDEVVRLVDQPSPSLKMALAPPRERVLVVDADTAFLRTFEAFSQGQLYQVIAARSPAEALQLARTQTPDAAVLDAHLDPPDGSFDLARRLRQLPGAEQLPIAVIASDPDLSTRVAAAHAGATLFLSKPLDEGLLRQTMLQLLAQRPTRPRVLIVDDDTDFRSQISLLLQRNGMDVTLLADGREVLDALEHERPDMVLLDMNLPGVSGVDLCRVLRSTPAWQDLPVLFLTAQTGVQTRVAAFEAGGDDYLAKPVVPQELLARIRVRLERARLMRERSEKDPLSGVLLRRPFMEALHAYAADARRKQRPLAVCLIDLDKFKAINDRYGHLAGDQVLATFGKLLLSRFRAIDLRGRWGGEEFVLAFPDVPLGTAQGIVQRVLDEFRQLPFPSETDGTFHASFSAGVASFSEDGETVQELMRVADRRLYAAKGAGRSRVAAEG